MYCKYNKWKINLLNLNSKSLLKLIKYINLDKIYFKKILYYLHKQYVSEISNIEYINKSSRIIFKKVCCINVQKLNNENIDKYNTIKWSIKINKNNIELVAIPNNKNHYTLCISSQIGCALNCSFCYTGTKGFTRNLKPYEIINQLTQASKRIKFIFNTKRITNIVFMGMGEPLLNIKNVLVSIDLITHKNAHNISLNKITLSTSGIIPYIDYINLNKIPLAISLHAPNDNLRNILMPINKKYSIINLLDKCKPIAEYNKLTIEYIMLKNINDSVNHALDLIKLLKNIKCKICLIPFNYFNGSQYKSSNFKNIIKFTNLLKKHGIMTTIRKKMGYEINAACGQLTSNL